MTERDLDIEREILEAVSAILSGFGPGQHAPPQDVYNRTIVSAHRFPESEFGWRIDLLEQQGMVEAFGRNLGGGFSIGLTSRGRHRLSMPEHEYRKASERTTTVSHQTIFQGSVGNYAQSHGSNSPITQHSETNPDLAKLFENLLTAIREHPSFSSMQKADAEVEAQQLQLELTRPNPNPERIKTATSFLIAYAPLVIEAIKAYLPQHFK